MRGISSEFPNSHKLFQKWTNIKLTEKTLANQVEKTGNILQAQEFDSESERVLVSQSQSIELSLKNPEKPELLYSNSHFESVV